MAQDIEDIIADDDTSEATVVKTQLSALVSDIKHLAAAEMEYLKLRIAYSGRVAKWITIYLILAILTGFSVLISIAVGLLLIITAYAGPIVATISTVIFFTLLTVICAMLARNYAEKLKFKDDQND